MVLGRVNLDNVRLKCDRGNFNLRTTWKWTRILSERGERQVHYYCTTSTILSPVPQVLPQKDRFRALDFAI